MKTTAKTAALVVAAVIVTASAAWALPTVSNVKMAQIPFTRLVEITYDLGVEEAIITLSIETNGVAIPDSAVTWLYDDVCKVVHPGSRTILWNAGENWSENVTATAKALVTAWCTNAPPLYCAVDVTGGTSATNYPVYYYTSAEAVPRGVTNNTYKTDRILMRRLAPTDAVGFIMGEGTDVKQVFLTHGFYAGVFQVTQGQWYNVMGVNQAEFTDAASRNFRPMEMVSYDDIRGADVGAGWPGSDLTDDDSFVGRLRAKTGLLRFDLPTEAQWEYACRAGTTTDFNDGLATFGNAQMNVLGRYAGNGGRINGSDPEWDCGPENGTAIVGTYRPNAWGLYDMHGNLFEWCLDWSGSVLSGGKDPRGATTGLKRMRRGGSWYSDAATCRSAIRNDFEPHRQNNKFGFRLVRIFQ